MSYKTKYQLICDLPSGGTVHCDGEGWSFCDNDIMEQFVSHMRKVSAERGTVHCDGEIAGCIILEDHKVYFEPSSEEFEPSMTFSVFDVRPCDDGAGKLAMAMVDLMKAHQSLSDAKNKVPLYTAQWSSEDYYKDELNTWYRTVEKFYDLINK